jgi:hypothetical protein
MLVSTSTTTPVQLVAQPATISTRRRMPRIDGLSLSLPSSRGIECPESLLAIESGRRRD